MCIRDRCRLIKPQHPDTIVIFLTANDQESDQIRGYEVGDVYKRQHHFLASVAVQIDGIEAAVDLR